MPPFITSKLQQAARFPVKKTMMIAQQLYEGIELPGEGAVGLITYMRTDSTRVADQALTDVREYIGQKLRARLSCPRSRTSTRRRPMRRTRTKRSGRRRCSTTRTSVRAHLTPDQYYLYRLIWNRFVASQMPPATFDETTVDVDAADVPVPRQGLGAEVRRLDGGLQPGAGRGSHRRSRSRRGQRRRRGRSQRAAGADRRRPARAAGAASPSRSSRSRRRATARPRWSRRSKRTASAGRAPTPRSSACIQDARLRQQDRRRASSRRCSA